MIDEISPEIGSWFSSHFEMFSVQGLFSYFLNCFENFSVIFSFNMSFSLVQSSFESKYLNVIGYNDSTVFNTVYNNIIKTNLAWELS